MTTKLLEAMPATDSSSDVLFKDKGHFGWKMQMRPDGSQFLGLRVPCLLKIGERIVYASSGSVTYDGFGDAILFLETGDIIRVRRPGQRAHKKRDGRR